IGTLVSVGDVVFSTIEQGQLNTNRTQQDLQAACTQTGVRALGGRSVKSILFKILFTMPSFLRRQESNGKFRLLKINPNN
ncbi:hypothetical protein, partial [Kingella kingae]|uniref:hypothetical protein n=1 Tax=Kingella kingae TaxID=504 RepID=UPI001EE233EB